MQLFALSPEQITVVWKQVVSYQGTCAVALGLKVFGWRWSVLHAQPLGNKLFTITICNWLPNAELCNRQVTTEVVKRLPSYF